MTLLLYNIRTKSHTSSIPIDTACLLYYILDERQVDVARVISNEIRMIASSGHRLGVVNDRYIQRHSTPRGQGPADLPATPSPSMQQQLQLQIHKPHVDHPLPTRDEFASFVDWHGDKTFHFVGAAGGGDVGHAGNAKDESNGETIGLEEASDSDED
ncbi:hypothetical protein KIW84_055472 [Lathyrus oleraceus]|uniref:Uncharacterized protein n=1 Tax=Pisum sativum TaxID=3888 RepID=A0A9D4WYT5_PEA|nr:hypothetical protein KIW84_055472 [Pisum sativum]